MKMILEKKEKGRITMLGTPSCPLKSGAEVEEQDTDMEERSRGQSHPCQGTLGEAFLEGGASALMHFCFLNLFSGTCHPVGYATGGLSWLAFNNPK